MKKIIIFSIAGFIICTAFNNPKNLTPKSIETKRTNKGLCTDYRDEYAGYYFCHSTITILNPKGPTTTKKDTITMQVSKDAMDSIIQIRIGRSIQKFKLKNRNLDAHPDWERRRGRFFATDSISIVMSGGHMATFMYTGKKK